MLIFHGKNELTIFAYLRLFNLINTWRFSDPGKQGNVTLKSKFGPRNSISLFPSRNEEKSEMHLFSISKWYQKGSKLLFLRTY